MKKTKKRLNNLFILTLVVVLGFCLYYITKFYLYILALLMLILCFKIYLWMRKERQIQAIRLSDVDNMAGLEFEYYIQNLLKSRGYDTKGTPASGDLGADIVATLGDIKYSVQVKRYSQAVDRTAVSDAVAAKDHYHCNQAMVITNNYFTPGAQKLAQSTKCILVDRDTLANWILDFQEDQIPIKRTFISKLNVGKGFIGLSLICFCFFLVYGILGSMSQAGKTDESSSPTDSIPAIAIPSNQVKTTDNILAKQEKYTPTELEVRNIMPQIVAETGEIIDILGSDLSSIKVAAESLPNNWKKGVYLVHYYNQDFEDNEIPGLFPYLMVESQGGILYIFWGVQDIGYYKETYEIRRQLNAKSAGSTLYIPIWDDDDIWETDEIWDRKYLTDEENYFKIYNRYNLEQ